jgi:hypothetical protein
VARSIGIVCYIFSGLLLASALVVPVIGVIAIIILSAWSDAASNVTLGAAASGMTLGAGRHGGPEIIIELAVRGVIWLLDILGPIPAILVALLTIVVEIGLLLGAGILFVIGRRLRRRPRPVVGPSITPLAPGLRQARPRR